MIDRLIDCTGPWSGKVQDSLCREQRLLKAQNCHAKPMILSSVLELEPTSFPSRFFDDIEIGSQTNLYFFIFTSY